MRRLALLLGFALCLLWAASGALNTAKDRIDAGQYSTMTHIEDLT